MKGDNTGNQPGNYGTIGVAAPSNKPGGRYEAAQWTDLQGNFWLYGGGLGLSAYFSDLWKYNPVTNEWTWMQGSQTTGQFAVHGVQGVPNAANTPGGTGLGALTWTDLNGNLWLYGGQNSSGGIFDDLWKYDLASNQWTWMHGNATAGTPAVYGTLGVPSPSNTPGARCEASCTWTDNNGDLWLFGGTPSGVGTELNDLWKYNIATNQWTWMSGDAIPNQPGVYGTIGVPNPANKPGARWCYSNWKDNAGNLWLFGGIDAASVIGMNFFNDLWKYDVVSGNWTWMSGSNTPNQPGVYGVQCVPSANNTPCARGETRSCWKDGCGNFWLLGGRDVSGDMYNDLWKYNASLNQWAWISGNSTPNQPGNYGVIQVASAGNMPGARMGAISWTNSQGLWLFGGYDFYGSQLNDLWKYIFSPDTAAFTTSPSFGCAPLSVSFNNMSAADCSSLNSYQWNFGDPASGTLDTSTAFSPSHLYNNTGIYTATLIVTHCNGTDTATAIINVGGIDSAGVNATPSGCISPTGSAAITVTGGIAPYTYLWSPAVSNISFADSLSPGNYSVIVTDSAGCADTLSFTILVDSANFNLYLGDDTALCSGTNFTINAPGSFPSYQWSTGAASSSITVNESGNYWLIASGILCSDTDSVSVFFMPDIILPDVSSSCDSNEILLDAGNITGARFLWSTGDTAHAIQVNQPGTYWVTASLANCIKSDTAIVGDFESRTEVWVPNAFTPNGDGKNETFAPVVTNAKDYSVLVFNRWGELIFETTNPIAGWNGTYKNKMCPEGVYVYIINFTSDCGAHVEKRTTTGHVTLIR